MKKTLLAAALLAGFATAGVAQAESSVTLYGILDASYTYTQFKFDGKFNKAAKNTHYKSTKSGLDGGNMNGNRWGLRGSEDLGDGLRAIFTLEQGFTLGNGEPATTRQFHRQAWVGLASDDWGTFTMGRQYNLGANFIYDSLAKSGYGISDPDGTFGGIGYGNRMDNSFKYVTPDFSGFKFGIAYGSNSEEIQRVSYDGTSIKDADKERHNWISTGLKYSNGPLTLAATYDRQNQNYDKAVTSWNLMAGYDFEVVNVTLAYGQDRHGKMGWGQYGVSKDLTDALNDNGQNYGLHKDFKSNNYYIGLSAPVGAGTLAVSWAMSDSNLDDISGVRAKKTNVYAAHYAYPLSKRTYLYGYANYATGLGYLDNLKGTQAGVGLRHAF